MFLFYYKQMVMKFFAIFIFSFITISTHAAHLDQNKLHEFELMVAQKLNRENLPGACVAIVDANQVFYKRCFGEANNETGEWLTPDHVFQLASMSKTFTSLLVADYVHAGVFDYDDPINQYVKTPLSNDIRISDLLSHRSGYKGKCAPIEKGYSYQQLKAQEFKQKMKNCELQNCHSYNNIAYNLLVYLL